MKDITRITPTKEALRARVLPLLRKGRAGLEEVAQIVDRLDVFTWGHSERVAQYALSFGRAMELEGEELDRLHVAGLLHDLGMVLCPYEIRNKPGKLTAPEFARVARHPEDAADLLAEVPAYVEIARIVRHHHERFDGVGYPDGLKGQAIPLESRILCVIDSYDSMVSNRPWRKPRTIEEAIAEIQACQRTQFDPVYAVSFAEFIQARWRERAQRLSAATFYAELSVRAYERVVREAQQRDPQATPQTLADQVTMRFPELSSDQCRKIVAGVVFEGKLRDDLYSDDVEQIKDNEVLLRHPARIDAEVSDVVRYSGQLHIVLEITPLDDGRFQYHLKR